MKPVLKKHGTKIRFALVGGINTLIDFGLLFAFSSLWGIPRGFSNILSTSVAFIFSFFANKRYTFKSTDKDNIVREMVLFAVVTLFGLWIIQSLIIHFLTPFIASFGLSDELSLFVAKLVATAASLIWNYILYSKVVFKSKST